MRWTRVFRVFRWLPALLLTAHGAAAEDVVVTVTGIRSAKGTILVAVCDEATFLQPTCRYKGRAPAATGSVTVRITGVPPGVYAAQAYGDENDNGRIDRTLFGVPTEGLGFSNDAKMRFGPPSFADAAVRVGPGGARIEFGLRYY